MESCVWNKVCMGIASWTTLITQLAQDLVEQAQEEAMHMEGSQRLQAHDASLRSRNSSLVQRCFHPSFVCTCATQKHCPSRFLSMCFPRLCLPLQLRSTTRCHGRRCNACACISPRFQNCKWNRNKNHNDLACPGVCLLPVAPHRLLCLGSLGRRCNWEGVSAREGWV